SEEMFREIFEESPICIELFDSNGILTGANRQTVEIFGVQGVEDLIGFDLFNDSNTPDLVKEELRKGNSISLETIFDFSKVQLHKQYRSSKTGIMHLQCMYSPLHYGRDEGLQGYIIHIQDVTERYVAEHSLMDSRESYKELYNNALIGLFRVRISDGMILECNDQFAKIFNFENSRILIDSSCFFKDFLPSSATWTQLKGTMKKQERLVIALAVTTKDGQRLWMRFSLRMWPDRGYIEGVMADITQEKQALGMLRKQKEELSDFAHTMSHDLKNIFQNMIGFIELMEDENDFTHLERLQALIFETSQLVDHSGALADAGLTVEEKLVMVDLDKLVRLIAESTIPELIEYIQDPLPVVKADEMKVTQIFRNLFDNAVNHGAPTKIEVKLDVRNTNFCIMIRNNGKEILEPARSKLFLKGFTTSKSGQGYGLTIVKRIVEAHDWTIQLIPSHMTSFELIIPKLDASG
ncbi:MAG: PAS domain-containing sensor histidine kinase, partial [Candidatus Thorarchaeota archaeon]